MVDPPFSIAEPILISHVGVAWDHELSSVILPRCELWLHPNGLPKKPLLISPLFDHGSSYHFYTRKIGLSSGAARCTQEAANV